MTRPAVFRTTPRIVAASVALVLVVAAVLLAVVGTGGRGSLLHPRAHGSPGAASGRTELAIAARYLGMSAPALRSQLRFGRSLADVAKQRGKTAAGLEHAILTGREAVIAGQKTLTTEQRKARLTLLRRRVARIVSRNRTSFALGAVRLQAAGHYLGTSAAKLRSALLQGQTLAAIASATPGRSPAGLVNALVEPREALLAHAARAGTITSAQEQHLLALLRARVEKTVQHAHG
jgi:hypothetical protein